MLHTLFQNFRTPTGRLGKVILFAMNRGHRPFWNWSWTDIPIPDHAHMLDIGCGAGGNIHTLLRQYPSVTVDGIDISEASVAYSQKTNAAYLVSRCTIRLGTAEQLPYEDNALDIITAFETIYFWPDLPRAFAEIYRILKSGGTFLIACEAGDPADTTWTKRIDGMVVYAPEELSRALQQAGFTPAMPQWHTKGLGTKPFRIIAKK